MENILKQVVVIAGPSGSGESTITNELLKRFPDGMRRQVSATTRAPRDGEVYGVDYYYFTKEQFIDERAKGNILEETYIVNRDTYYGSYKPDLDKKLADGFIVIKNPDLVGAKYYSEHYNAATIFIMPENLGELLSRIKLRNPDMSEEELSQRQENAKQEIEIESPFYTYKIINANGKLEQAVQDVISILKKEGYNLVY